MKTILTNRLAPGLSAAIDVMLIMVCTSCTQIDDRGTSTDHSGAVLDASAVARIGRGEDQPLFQVVGAVFLGDTIVIAERSTGTLRFHHRTGELIKVVGGKGSGPGEFVDLTWIQEVNKGLFAYDRGQQRVSEFARDGSFIGSTNITEIALSQFAIPVAVFDDGSILLQTVDSPVGTRADGTTRSTFGIVRYQPETRRIDSLGSFQGSEMHVEPWGRGGQLSSRLVFGKQSRVVATGSNYFVLENDDSGIRVFDASGTKVSELRMPLEPVAVRVTAADLEIARTSFTRNETPGSKLGPVFDRMDIPDILPVFGWYGARRLKLMRVSHEYLWVIRSTGVRDPGPTWIVFTRDGVVKGHLTATEELDILDLRADIAVVLVWNDEDVETVELRRVLW